MATVRPHFALLVLVCGAALAFEPSMGLKDFEFIGWDSSDGLLTPGVEDSWATRYGEGRSLLQNKGHGAVGILGTYGDTTSVAPDNIFEMLGWGGILEKDKLCKDYYRSKVNGKSAQDVNNEVIANILQRLVKNLLASSAKDPIVPPGVTTTPYGKGCESGAAGGSEENFQRFLKIEVIMQLTVGKEKAVLEEFMKLLNDGTITNECKLALINAGLDPDWAPQPLSYKNGDPNVCFPNVNPADCPDMPTPDSTDPPVTPDTTVPIQVDGYVQNDKWCIVFWRKSSPRGKKPPNAAVRLGLRTVADKVASNLGLTKKKDGGIYKIVRMSNLCTNAPRKAKGKFRLIKRMRTTVTPKIPRDKQVDFLILLRSYVEQGEFYQASVAWGAGEWAPKPFYYKNKASAVCMPQHEELSGWCAKRWKPKRVVPLM